jgi:hypothetical protein
MSIQDTVDARYALDDPADQQATFTNDPMHFPFAVSPLFQSVHVTTFPVGYMIAVRALNIPIQDFQVRHRNNFQFERTVPIPFSSEEEGQQAAHLAQETFQAEFARMGDRWETEHLPRILAIQEELRGIAATDRDDAITPATVDRLRDLLIETWGIHFQIAMPSLIALQIFDEFAAEVFGESLDPHTLVSGVATRTTDAGAALSDLAAAAQSLGVAGILLENEPSTARERLENSDAGRQFLAQFDDFLQEYGLRQQIYDLITPTWQEHVDIPLNAVRAFLESGGDNRAMHDEQIRRSEEATAAAREHLTAYPEQVRG